jgi:hypothetical protein
MKTLIIKTALKLQNKPQLSIKEALKEVVFEDESKFSYLFNSDKVFRDQFVNKMALYLGN